METKKVKKHRESLTSIGFLLFGARGGDAGANTPRAREMPRAVELEPVHLKGDRQRDKPDEHYGHLQHRRRSVDRRNRYAGVSWRRGRWRLRGGDEECGKRHFEDVLRVARHDEVVERKRVTHAHCEEHWQHAEHENEQLCHSQ